MSSVYLERRHFTEAIKCLDEAEEIAGDKVPDLFFRRSQARTYNKYSTYKDLELAMQDLENAFKSNIEFNERNKDNFMSKNDNFEVYTEHKLILEKIMTNKLNSNINRFRCILNHTKESYKLVKERNKKAGECFYSRAEDQIRQYKILKE